ncbi:MAG: sensor histidine kinase [Caldilinea sp. CFX5]|nr:sensor histidine kinase [Caldilinea sp. CFX5]
METRIDDKQGTKQAQQTPAWLLDLLLGIAVTLVIALVISADQGGHQDPDLIAYLFACGFGVLMLIRRHFPVVVLVATMFLLFGYYALDYPAIGLAVPVAASLYSAAEQGQVAAAILVSFLLIGVSTGIRLRDGQPVAYLLGYELISTVTMMAAAIALGDSTRARRSLRAEQEQSARLIAQEHAYRAEQRVQAERVRMARDLHDLIGHSISVISLQADVAREAMGHNDAEAQQALSHIRTTTSETMRELRATVKLLRNPTSEQSERSITTLANLSALVENARASGLTVDLECKGEFQSLSATVSTAAYRIIQEALTNVIRHANATQVTITMERNAHALDLHIVDNGKSPAAPLTPGSGITGMSERAKLLGGTLSAQPLPAGGFAVHALLPWEEAR